MGLRDAFEASERYRRRQQADIGADGGAAAFWRQHVAAQHLYAQFSNPAVLTRGEVRACVAVLTRPFATPLTPLLLYA